MVLCSSETYLLSTSKQDKDKHCQELFLKNNGIKSNEKMYIELLCVLTLFPRREGKKDEVEQTKQVNYLSISWTNHSFMS